MTESQSISTNTYRDISRHSKKSSKASYSTRKPFWPILILKTEILDSRHAAEEERKPEDATLDKLGNFTQRKLKKYLTTRSISDTTNIYLLGEKKRKKKTSAGPFEKLFHHHRNRSPYYTWKVKRYQVLD